MSHLINQSDLFALAATLFMCVFQLRKDIHPQVPDTVYNLKDLTMEYVLCSEWGPG